MGFPAGYFRIINFRSRNGFFSIGGKKSVKKVPWWGWVIMLGIAVVGFEIVSYAIAYYYGIKTLFSSMGTSNQNS